MKARDRYTDETVEIISYCGTTQRNEDVDRVSYIDSKGQEHPNEKLNYYWDFEPIANSRSEIDWEQRRYEVAKTAMLGLMAGHHTIYSADKLPAVAIEYADALINKLKKEDKQ